MKVFIITIIIIIVIINISSLPPIVGMKMEQLLMCSVNVQSSAGVRNDCFRGKEGKNCPRRSFPLLKWKQSHPEDGFLFLLGYYNRSECLRLAFLYSDLSHLSRTSGLPHQNLGVKNSARRPGNSPKAASRQTFSRKKPESPSAQPGALLEASSGSETKQCVRSTDAEARLPGFKSLLSHLLCDLGSFWVTLSFIQSINRFRSSASRRGEVFTMGRGGDCEVFRAEEGCGPCSLGVGQARQLHLVSYLLRLMGRGKPLKRS
ncbi:uncharacterized protein [Callorhinus ursinus]|uniref:uncharacterized protein n=1 Tax=Callorhinus ursinus TaxID=34884 RepID=UPI003CD005A3